MGSAALLGGCFTNVPARGEPRPASALPSSVWPDLPTDDVAQIAQSTPDVVRTYERTEATTGDEAVIEAVMSAATWRLRDMRLDDHGLLRIWEGGPTRPVGLDLFDVGGPVRPFNGSYLTERAVDHELDRREAVAAVWRDAPVKLPSASPPYGLRMIDSRENHLIDVGVQVRVDDPPAAPRGIVIHVPATITTGYEMKILDRLAAHGWAVARVEHALRAPGPRDIEITVTTERIRARTLERIRAAHPDSSYVRPDDLGGVLASFLHTEGVEWGRIWSEEFEANPPPPHAAAFLPGQDPVAHGATLARRADEQFVERAYAAEGVVGLLDAKAPALGERPIIVVGVSAGALVAPTIAARLREVHGTRMAGLVLVGGGGDVLTIGLETEAPLGGLRLAPPDEPGPDGADLLRIKAGYLAATQFDPLVLAGALRELPVLHVYATEDTWVPTAAAEAFNDVHGHVDGIVFSGGHPMMFYFLPRQAAAIERWIDLHVP